MSDNEKLENNDAAGEHGGIDQVSLAIFVIFFTMLTGALVKELTKKIPIPYAAAIFLLGTSPFL